MLVIGAPGTDQTFYASFLRIKAGYVSKTNRAFRISEMYDKFSIAQIRQHVHIHEHVELICKQLRRIILTI